MIKWYDILGLIVPIGSLGILLYMYLVASQNGWIAPWDMNYYGEGRLELVAIGICFIWAVISYVRLLWLYKKN